MSPSLIHSETREAQFAAEVEQLVRAGGNDGRRALIGLCDESHPAYQEQPTSAVNRMRGWVLESLCRTGPLPDEAVPFVLEELETAHDSYLIAVAASCLRTYPQPLASFAPALSEASRNAPGVEAPVTLGVYGGLGPPRGAATSPMKELAATIDWMGPQAVLPEDSCCAELPEGIVRLFRRRMSPSSSASQRAVDGVALEDHTELTRSFRERFRGQPSIVVFFYTRCDNPLKCTLTISKLARVQSILENRGLFDQIHTAGISYDPAYDTPERLLRYGRNRGFRVDNDGHFLLRAPEQLEILKRHFELGVSFFESLVSRHRIDVFVLDREGRVAFTFQRLNWSESEAVDRAAALLGKKPPPAVLSPIAGIAASVVPKCPVCWATYMSAIGVTGSVPVLGSVTLKVLAAFLLTIHLILALWRIRSTGWRLPHTLTLLGVAAIAANVVGSTPVPGLAAAGAALMLIASVLTVRQYGRSE